MLSVGFVGIPWYENQVDAARPGPSSFIVDLEGGSDFTSIQSAIDSAKSGDTIYVWAGTYYENVVIDKPLTLIGNHSSSTFIDACSFGDVVRIEANHVNFFGFSLMNSGNGSYREYVHGYYCQNAGISLKGNYNHINDTIVAYNYYGIKLSGRYFVLWRPQ